MRGAFAHKLSALAVVQFRFDSRKSGGDLPPSTLENKRFQNHRFDAHPDGYDCEHSRVYSVYAFNHMFILYILTKTERRIPAALNQSSQFQIRT